MKHLLIDALSVNNLSGRHVLLGHVRECVAALSEEWRFTVLTHRDNVDVAADMPEAVAREVAPIGAGWRARAWWCLRHFRHYARTHAVDLVFSPAGMLTPGCTLPQIVLAQNPWPLVARERGMAALRLWLQRRGYARAQARAWRMVFNSQHMEQLYRTAFGPSRRPGVVAHQGVSDALLDAMPPECTVDAREPLVLSVSVMARHKAIDLLVRAFAEATRGLPAVRLELLGHWPDAAYRREVEALIAQLDLQSRVDLAGHVDAARLHDRYARARVFCLLSRCESFGIPAIEAQALATPCVVAAGTAAPEIAGPGGVVVPVDDAHAAATALRSLLTDDAQWMDAAQRARANALRFRWSSCSAPLVQVLRDFATGRGN
jgi:glycosyltransferase involved in cell wall biosynthesis